MIQLYQDQLKVNIKKIFEKISKAAIKNNRIIDDIKVVAVTKKIPIELINILKEYGIKEFAESRVQEFIPKHEQIKDVNWHMIGRLQKNKIKYIIDKVNMIHSIDSYELARHIDLQAKNNNLHIDGLIQLNISNEPSKQGLSESELHENIEKFNEFKNLHIKGLMTMAPFSKNSDEIRWVFSKMKAISLDIKMEKLDNISVDFLSMGMSNDFETAIEEGSNLVRIGSAFFEGIRIDQINEAHMKRGGDVYVEDTK